MQAVHIRPYYTVITLCGEIARGQWDYYGQVDWPRGLSWLKEQYCSKCISNGPSQEEIDYGIWYDSIR